MMPLPHTVTIKRPKWTDTRREQYRGEETIATGVRALISPKGSVTRANWEWGGIDLEDDVIFLEVGVDVQRGDVIINEATGERWRVTKPPVTYQNPITWEDDHIEAAVEKEVLGQ